MGTITFGNLGLYSPYLSIGKKFDTFRMVTLEVWVKLSFMGPVVTVTTTRMAWPRVKTLEITALPATRETVLHIGIKGKLHDRLSFILSSSPSVKPNFLKELIKKLGCHRLNTVLQHDCQQT